MKFMKTAKKALFCPILGVFLTSLALSLLYSATHAMEPMAPAILRTSTMSIVPEQSDDITEDVTDDETRIYLPEIKKTKRNNPHTAFACTYEDCTHRATTKSNLNQHVLNRHTDKKRYLCTFADCNYGAQYQSVLKKHIQNKHSFEKQ